MKRSKLRALRWTTASMATLALASSVSAQEASVMPEALKFGALEAGEAAKSTLTVTNTDPLINLVVWSISMDSDPDDAFEVTLVNPDTPVILRPSNSILVEVEFAPVCIGTLTGTVLVESSDMDQPHIYVPLIGQGVVPGTTTTYHYEGLPFIDVLGDYTTSDRVVGSFTVASPFPPNMTMQDVTSSVVSFSFSDGPQIYTGESFVVSPSFVFSTDVEGNPTMPWDVRLMVNTVVRIETLGTERSSLDFGSNGSLSFGNNWASPGIWTMAGTDTLGTPYCFGDGSGVLCPCGNAGAIGHGCANSGSAKGGLLAATGTASVGADSTVLFASGGPANKPGIFFSGSAQVSGGLGDPFGDGLLCSEGTIVRLQTVFLDAAGAAQSSVSLSDVGGLSPGDTRHYQYWFRDPDGSPCGTGFNTTNALTIDWN